MGSHVSKHKDVLRAAYFSSTELGHKTWKSDIKTSISLIHYFTILLLGCASLEKLLHGTRLQLSTTGVLSRLLAALFLMLTGVGMLSNTLLTSSICSGLVKLISVICLSTHCWNAKSGSVSFGLLYLSSTLAYSTRRSCWRCYSLYHAKIQLRKSLVTYAKQFEKEFSRLYDLFSVPLYEFDGSLRCGHGVQYQGAFFDERVYKRFSSCLSISNSAVACANVGNFAPVVVC